MPTVYVIHALEDESTVKHQLLPYLAINGYDHWLSRHHLRGGSGEALEVKNTTDAMMGCAGVVAVVTTELLSSEAAAQEVDIAIEMPGRTIVHVSLGWTDEEETGRLPTRLWTMPRVDLTTDSPEDAGLLVGDLLPPVDLSTPETGPPAGAERTPWDEGTFNHALVRATERHDYGRAETLVETLARHLRDAGTSYPAQAAFGDLACLRRERVFQLMRRYADAVIASGTTDAGVRRMLAQALIEIREFGRALDVLESILDDPGASSEEVFEAHGLVGRTFKQRYVEKPDRPESRDLLRRAIDSYHAVYEQDPGRFWHGVNAASCILRSERDGVRYGSSGLAQRIAAQVERDISRLADQGGPLDVWDCASRVESLVDLGRFDEADVAVDAYLEHPAMTAFEVSSTFRQFEQVLQLGTRQQGASILEKLRLAVERHRSGSMLERPAPQGPAANESDEASDERSLLIRLAELWNPVGIPDLVVESRLGQVVTARGTAKSVRQLLADPRVISVEESRPAGRLDCERSVPFIGVAAQYGDSANPFEETGENALVAVIDNGIDVLQEAFLDAQGHSRIIGIWDQSGTVGSPPPGFEYGVYHDEAAIAGYAQDGFAPQTLQRNIDGHGTHVASIAAGRRTSSFAGGVAPGAKILVVVSTGNESTGYSKSHVDALVFIDGIAKDKKLPVVVNVSQGMNAGAHDGKSALEVAFDAFSGSGRTPGRVVVKSAGNERGKGGHAKLTLMPDSLDRLRWLRPEKGADYSNRIELWWSSADQLEFRLRDPSGGWTDWVGRTLPAYQASSPGVGPIRMSFIKRHIDNGDSRLLIELGDVTASAAVGEWLLEARSRATADGGIVHAWVERGRGEPTRFLDHQDEEMTLSIPGTASSVIAVGAVDASQPIWVGDFSSYGPTRDGQRKPLVCAPGVDVNAARGGVGDGTILMSGTSQAAPHVAGAIALLLSRAATKESVLNSNQIAAALRQKTQNVHHWDRGQGYGLVNVPQVLGTFE